MLLQERGKAAKANLKLYCCHTAIYETYEILAYLRAKETFVISIARKWHFVRFRDALFFPPFVLF